MNRCTYNDMPNCCGKLQGSAEKDSAKKGYLYQLVYSCRTCYNDLIVDKLSEMAKKATEPESKLPMNEIAKLKPDQIAAHSKSM